MTVAPHTATCLHCGAELEPARLTDGSAAMVERLGLVLAPIVRSDGEILLATVPSFRVHECREEGAA